ncbi:MAG TPA: FG-GAP repeat protein [Phycisphaerae bacterium]|nr:FG-GAP repeat protein [Phycisphaerae bacterium]
MRCPKMSATIFTFAVGGLVLAGSAGVAHAQCQANELAKLTASDAAAYDAYGHCVSISGDVAVVGAWEDIHAGVSSGSAYVYRLNGADWVEEVKLVATDAATNDEFGVSVAVSGDVAVIGAHLDDDGGPDSGSAYVYSFDGTEWIEQAKLTASDATPYDNFGWSVSISGDAVVVGANLNDDAGPNSGSAYVFKRPPGGWVDMTETAKLTAGDATENDEFGRCVAISGDVVAIGAHYDSDDAFQSGSAYVFVKPPSGWESMTAETAKLTASDPSDLDRLGLAVAIDGDVVVAGAWADDDGGSASGSAYVYNQPLDGWADMTETAKLAASDAAAGDHFGWSVSINGDVAMIGAPAHLWDGSGFGSAYAYRFDGTDWIEEAKLTASDGAEDDEFGYSVSISGDAAVIGSRYHTTGGYDNAGATYLYRGLSDCNDNRVLDICDITDGTSPDDNGNGIPDECECPGDLDGDGDTDQADLGILLSDWGCTGGNCPGDLNADGNTDQADLGILLADWGCAP